MLTHMLTSLVIWLTKMLMVLVIRAENLMKVGDLVSFVEFRFCSGVAVL